jgi:oligoendopeptidase F
MADEIRGTIYRQTMFAEFELLIHEDAANNIPLTADHLSKKYYDLNKLYHNDGIANPDKLIELEWARIPHFYYNYYVFQYATGYSAAIALSRKVLDGGEKELNDYLGFLSGGCSKSPIDLLKGAGVDMNSPEPVNQALELFGKLLDEMEELMAG